MTRPPLFTLRRRAGWSLAAMFAVLPQAAFAQTGTPGDQTARQDGNALRDIVVTAQRRDESLSKTPVAVSVLSSDTLAKSQITTEQDLRTALPGLAIRAGSNTNQSNYAIRGNSQDVFSNTKPGVMPYINEVQVSGAGGSTAFYDLQSVQLLKGPQGTLFGRSATGGAVLFTTARPGETFGGYASVSFGNYSEEKFEGAINLPVTHALRLRVSGFQQRRDGYQQNQYDGLKLGKVDRWGLRGSMSLDVTDRLHNDLVVDYYRADNTNVSPVISGLMPFSGNSPPPYVPLAALYGGVSTPETRSLGISVLQQFSGASQAAATAFYDAYFANPRHPASGVAGVLAAQIARGPYVADVDANMAYGARNWLVTDTTAYDLTDAIVAKSIFGYVDVDNRTAYELDGTPYLVSENGPLGSDNFVRNRIKAISEEVQIQGKALDWALDFVSGFYFSHETSNNYQPGSAFDLVFGGLFVPNNYKLTNSTYAPYAQATYRLAGSLSVTGGIRYTSEKADYATLPGDSNYIAHGGVAPTGFSFDQSRTFNKLSWHVGIQSQLLPSLLLYVSSGQAYKSGGFNGSAAPRIGGAAEAGNAYDPERLIALELGAKFKGYIGGTPARFDVAFYRNWIADRQTTATALVDGGPAALTVNVPKAVVQGVELNGLVKPAKWLTLGGTFNYTDAKFTGSTAFVNGVRQDFDQIPDAPKISGSVYSDVTVPMSADVELLLHGDVFFQSKSYLSPQSSNNFGTILPDYAVANFRIGLESRQGWSLTANLKNAFDRIYYVGGVPTGTIFQINSLIPGEPRMFTVELRYKF